ncbi:MAG: DnaJ domain-containing protein, partial [Burkholderiaceae bacterium]
MDEAPDDLKQQRLAKVLLDFGRAPGKYPVRLGEPRELHKELDTLTVWALGRLPKALESDTGALRDAAVLFIARACFAPEATHYQMFGLTPGTCTPEALRARYRNLIRLTHPDMGVKGLPATAAGAVNRAQGVLSDPEQRRRYDEELAERKANASSADRERAAARAMGVGRIEHKVTLAERWQSLKARFPNLARTGALAGGVAVVAIGLLVLALTGQNDERTLIAARSPDEASTSVADRKRPDSAP